MEEELQPADVKARAVKGVASLLTRQFLVRLIGFAGMLVLARILTPQIFGVFAICQFIVLFFEQVSSLGLSAALIRKKAAVDERELRTVFTVQQIVVALSIVLILGAAPLIASHYQLPAEDVALIRVMALALLLASLKTIPTVLLERRLRHDLIAASEIAEYLAYQLIAILLAYLGLGVWALIAALIARGLVGVAILSRVSWWRPAFGIERRTLGEVMRFGVPIQAANLLSLANNAVVPVLVGSMLGAAAVGVASFARSIVDALLFQPVILMGRVQLRVFGHAQEDRQRLGNLLERAIYQGSVLTFLLAALIVSQAQPFITLIATLKWSAALPLLYVLAPAFLAQAVAQPLIQALKALGDARTSLLSVLIQVLVQTAVFLWGAERFGLVAYAWGAALGIVLATLLAWYRMRAHLRVAVWSNVTVPLVGAVAAAAVATVVNRNLTGIAGMTLSIASAVLVYFALLALLAGKRLAREVSGVVNTLLPGSSAAGALLRMQRLR
ncbi:MAG TPA: oligosaccharide flippase family protein [Steroidobacteraceae bacterium]|nr:oligosaccharide flippase family protein [Steroidobacteraceae bacterium]